MYQAPIVALLICATYIWAYLGTRLEQAGVKVPLYLHYYGFLYTMLFYLTGVGMHGMWRDIMNPTDWLDPNSTDTFVRSIMQENHELDEDDGRVYAMWQDESDMSTFQRLKWFSMLSPFWVLLTILVCVYHTHLHVNKVRYYNGGTAGRLCDAPQHDQTIKVLALPVVYGLMSFKSVTRMWQVMINHVPVAAVVDADGTPGVMFHGYEERKSFLLEMYDANFMVGDIYETIALVTFGHLVMGVLKKKIDKMRDQFEKSNTNTEFSAYVQRLVDSMRTLTVAGVKLFAMSCFLQGTYTLVITTMAFDFPKILPTVFSMDVSSLGMCQTVATKEFMHDFFLGAGFIASCAAIGNIMIIEEDFEELLHEFKPAYKFWGTKILVSLAFLQSILISVFLTPRGWSVIQSNLFYACALCLECLLISIFHLKGWSADEEWYGDLPEPGKEGLLEGEHKNIKIADTPK